MRGTWNCRRADLRECWDWDVPPAVLNQDEGSGSCVSIGTSHWARDAQLGAFCQQLPGNWGARASVLGGNVSEWYSAPPLHHYLAVHSLPPGQHCDWGF